MRAEKKLQALDNLQRNKFIIQTGTIIVQGINEEALARLLHTFNKYDVKNVVMRTQKCRATW